MKRIGITQRVEQVENYAERRDCLDQRWTELVWQLGYILVPLPNLLSSQVPELLNGLKLDAILLSGGNSIARLDPAASDAAPERDALEEAVLKEALKRDIAVLGVCRGMQMINLCLGGKIIPVKGHVGVPHKLSTIDESYPLPQTVNSYHNWGISKNGLARDLKPLAVDAGGNIEAFSHVHKQVFGIMWHPERELPFVSSDIELLKRILS